MAQRDERHVAPESFVRVHVQEHVTGPRPPAASVTTPTFAIRAVRKASITPTSFCTVRFLSGRMTTATSAPFSWRSVSSRPGEPGQRHGLAVERDDLVAVDGQRAHLFGVHRMVAARAAGQGEVVVVFEQRRGDHENHQQHETQVEHRRDVDLGESLQTLALRNGGA